MVAFIFLGGSQRRWPILGCADVAHVHPLWSVWLSRVQRAPRWRRDAKAHVLHGRKNDIPSFHCVYEKLRSCGTSSLYVAHISILVLFIEFSICDLSHALYPSF